MASVCVAGLLIRDMLLRLHLSTRNWQQDCSTTSRRLQMPSGARFKPQFSVGENWVAQLVATTNDIKISLP